MWLRTIGMKDTQTLMAEALLYTCSVVKYERSGILYFLVSKRTTNEAK